MVGGGATGDVIGVLDSENNITLEGDIPDGYYTFRYKNTNGSYTDPIRIYVGTSYKVTLNLANATSSNPASTVLIGDSYSTTITANSGYELESVTATMDGDPVSVTDGVINIPSVTGPIVITATTTEAALYKNFAVPTDATGQSVWESGAWCNNSFIAGSSYAYREATDGRFTTNLFDVENGDIVYVKGIRYSADSYCQAACLDADGNRIYNASVSLTVTNNFLSDLNATAGEDYWSLKVGGKTGNDTGVRQIRFAGYASGSIYDVIITRNEPIQ